MPLVEPVPDLRSLDMLCSVAELGSIRQAAARHGVSQPAASVRLRTLEDVLGVELLDRSRGRAELTTAGIAVVQWAQEVLEPMRNLQAAAKALEAVRQSQLCLVASLTVAEYLVPGWLQRLRQSAPDAVVSLDMGNSAHVAEVIDAGRADLGFVEGLHVPSHLTSRVIQSDDLVVVVSASHPWARRRRPLYAEELASTPVVVRETGSGTREVLEAGLGRHGLKVIPRVELGSTTAIKAAVESGAGPGVLSKLAVEVDVREGRLVALEVEDLVLHRSLRAVWSRSSALTANARLLLRLIGDTAGA